MATITMENSGWSGNGDMGDSHVEAHSEQRQFLQEDEPFIETLTDNKTGDLSTSLVLDYALKNGYKKSPEEWAKLPPSKQKGSYDVYFGSLFLRTAKAKKKRLDNKKTTPTTRRRIGQELASLQHNGMIIDSSLFYISNTAIYQDMDKDELKKYRHFERKTFERFYKSKTFQELNPELIRAEIHFDEMGAMHLQTQQEWLYKDGRNRSSYSKRAVIKKLLIKKYGSEKELQNRLDALCFFHHNFGKVNKGDTVKPGVDRRPDLAYLEYAESGRPLRVSRSAKKNTKTKDGYRDFAYSAPERRTRLTELWRLEQISELRAIALQTAKEMNVDYSVDQHYTTDNKHRNRVQYLEHQHLKGVNGQLSDDNQKLTGQIKDSKKALSATNKDIATAAAQSAKQNAELEKATKAKNETEAAVRNAYTAITGRMPVDKNGKDFSTEKTVEAIKQAVSGLKNDADKQQKRLTDAQTAADTLEASNKEAKATLTDTKKQQQEENKQLQKLRTQRQQRQQEATEEQEQQQKTFQENEKLLSSQSNSLNGLKAATKAEQKKLNQLKQQRRQQEQQPEQKELRAKAAEYDKINAAVGNEVPQGVTLADYVISKFSLFAKRAKQRIENNQHIVKMQTAIVKFLRLSGVKINDDVANVYSTTEDNKQRDVLTDTINERYQQISGGIEKNRQKNAAANRKQKQDQSAWGE